LNDSILLHDLLEAYFKARKNKRNKKDQVEFEQNFESSLMGLHKQIVQREFKPQNYTAFVNKKPVIREVFAPSFRDRVVHHLLYKYLSEIYEPYFINDSYSCRVGKGTLYGVYRLKDMLYSCSNGYSKDCYVLKLDISGYFYNINKNILYKMCCGKMKKHFLKDKYELVDYLLRKILFDDVIDGAVKISRLSDWKLLRKDRSLYNTPRDIGLPIGNLTSQLFSNIYMNEFDNFMKDDLDIKYYGRYVDDSVIVHKDKEFLKKLIKTSQNFLRNNLGLEIHPNKIYLQHYVKGVEFLGAFIKPNRVYAGSRIKGNFIAFIVSINNILEEKTCILGKDEIMKIRATFNSYLGLLSKFNTFKLRVKCINMLKTCFYRYFYFSNDLRKVTIKI
jgi:hypothetical protein